MTINKIYTFRGKEVRVYAIELNNNSVSCDAQFVEDESLDCTRVKFREAIYKYTNIYEALDYYSAHLKEYYIK